MRVLFCIAVLLISVISAKAEPPTEPDHWAYRAPAPQPFPLLKDPTWCRQEVDYWSLSAMEHAGLAPSPEADRPTLLRRVFLDLIGLPPTPEERERFLADPAPDAYERLVDRLLSSPRFGERWAAMWLDLARFADSQGYEKDNLRTIWAYRDWVIKAFNDDLPFDRFTIEQLAGDLLPEPSGDQLVATAFHRNTMTNTEGGTDDEEFRLKAVIDRVHTTATVWLGLTAGCAQCHDHPSAPMAQHEFYGLMAFFNNTADANRKDDAPVLSLVPLAERERGTAGETAAETLVPIMRELTGSERRITRRFHLGNWLDPREEVAPATPAFLHRFPAGLSHDRLGLAQWLVSKENPLTARVMVNRIWEQLFGTGLVETCEDFGSAEPAPSNQPLLDSLALRFQGPLGWSVKRLLREIVLSATYRQTAEVSAEHRARDPENRLLSRGPRFRLSAEMIRDQALAVAGLLSPKMYGRSVMPPQPEGVWSVVYNVQRWVPSRGEDRYRRALYTFWRRTSPYPAATLFDAPSREACTARRTRTNSPAAALVTLNDPVFVGAAAALGRRMKIEGGATDEERIRYGWKLLLAREPGAVAVAELLKLLKTAEAEENPYDTVAAALLNLDDVLCR